MASQGVQLIFGGASFMDEERFGGLDKIREALDILEKEGVKIIDTAMIYQESEEILGKTKAASRFTIDTKYPGGFQPDTSSKEAILAVAEQSLTKLQTDQVDVYYLHSPDRRVPLEDLLEAVNQLHQAGKIKRFGLSNFLAEEVEEVIRIAREKNYIVPTVYQGNYSAVARRQEKELFPTLRKHGLSFYAYSPIAGGFLVKNVDEVLAGTEGRWDKNSQVGAIYQALYNKPKLVEGLQEWAKISKESGISKVELAYRWVVHNSDLKRESNDGVIFGVRNLEQLNETLAAIRQGPLSAEIVERIEQVWKIVEAEAPLDNYNDLFGKKTE